MGSGSEHPPPTRLHACQEGRPRSMQPLRFSDTSWRVVRHHRADETRVSPRQQGYRHRVVNEVVTRGNRHQEARFDRASPRLPVQLAVAVAVGQPLAALLAVGHALSARGGEPFQSPHCASHPRQASQQSCGPSLPPPKGASAAPSAPRPTRRSCRAPDLQHPAFGRTKVSLWAPSPLWFQTSS